MLDKYVLIEGREEEGRQGEKDEDREKSELASAFQCLKWREYENYCNKEDGKTEKNTTALNLGCKWSLIRRFCC